MRALVVEDDPLLRGVLASVLADRRHDVLELADGWAGWGACQREAFALAVVDVGLPLLDGLELCRRLRELAGGDLPAVLVVTARNAAEDVLAALRAGADDYLPKPFELEELETRLGSLERIAAERARRAAAEADRDRVAAAAERQAAELAAVLAATDAGVLVVDPDLRVRFASPAFATVFGLDAPPPPGTHKPTLLRERLKVRAADPDAFERRLLHLYAYPWEEALDDVDISGPPSRALRRYSGPVWLDGRLLGRVEVYTDVTVQRALARVEERERVAMDLHDGAVQTLFGLRMRLRAGQRLAGPAEGPLAEAWAELDAGLEGAIAQLRGYIRVLQAPTGAPTGTLRERLAAVADALPGVAGLRLALRIDPTAEGALGADGQDHLVGVAQEALANALRHAGASRVDLVVACRWKRLVLTVRDDGRGYDPATVRKGMGLANLERRAALLGGALTITSAPGRGCRVRLSVPLG